MAGISRIGRRTVAKVPIVACSAQRGIGKLYRRAIDANGTTRINSKCSNRRIEQADFGQNTVFTSTIAVADEYFYKTLTAAPPGNDAGVAGKAGRCTAGDLPGVGKPGQVGYHQIDLCTVFAGYEA